VRRKGTEVTHPNTNHVHEPRLRFGRWYKVEEKGQELMEPTPVIFTRFRKELSGAWRPERLGSFIGEHEEQQLLALYVYATSPGQARQFYLRGLAEARRRFARLAAAEGDLPAA
jgi:hypothetical protein